MTTTSSTFALQVLQYKTSFRMGVARPLSQALQSDRHLTARYAGHSKDCSEGTLLGISIALSALAFPEPGCLAAWLLHFAPSQLAVYICC